MNKKAVNRELLQLYKGLLPRGLPTSDFLGREEKEKKRLTSMTILCSSSIQILVQTRFLCHWNRDEELLNETGLICFPSAIGL
jgi:hypothetical protein